NNFALLQHNLAVLQCKLLCRNRSLHCSTVSFRGEKQTSVARCNDDLQQNGGLLQQNKWSHRGATGTLQQTKEIGEAGERSCSAARDFAANDRKARSVLDSLRHRSATLGHCPGMREGASPSPAQV